MSVKYLPPITSMLAATPPVSAPVPIYRRSPPLACDPTWYEWASSPVATADGAPEVPEFLILIIVAISKILRLFW